VITSPLRPRTQRQESGIAASGQLAHPRNALRRFTFVRHHDASRASFRPALTEAPAAQPSRTGDRPVNSGPRPCLRCWIPPIGLQVRTPTSDLHIRARHTSGSALGPRLRRTPQASAARRRPGGSRATPVANHDRRRLTALCGRAAAQCRRPLELRSPRSSVATLAGFPTSTRGPLQMSTLTPDRQRDDGASV
jgi:hypothetical protein